MWPKHGKIQTQWVFPPQGVAPCAPCPVSVRVWAEVSGLYCPGGGGGGCAQPELHYPAACVHAPGETEGEKKCVLPLSVGAKGLHLTEDVCIC